MSNSRLPPLHHLRCVSMRYSCPQPHRPKVVHIHGLPVSLLQDPPGGRIVLLLPDTPGSLRVRKDTIPGSCPFERGIEPGTGRGKGETPPPHPTLRGVALHLVERKHVAMATVKDVPADAFIEAYAEHLKSSDKVRVSDPKGGVAHRQVDEEEARAGRDAGGADGSPPARRVRGKAGEEVVQTCKTSRSRPEPRKENERAVVDGLADPTTTLGLFRPPAFDDASST